MFCSVQEAWPEYYNDNKNDKINLYNVNKVDNYKKQLIGINPHIKSKKNEISLQYNNIEDFNEEYNIEEFNEDNNIDCKKIIQHIEYCKICKDKLNINNNSLMNNIKNISEETKETIVIFLTGFIIILLIHLFHK